VKPRKKKEFYRTEKYNPVAPQNKTNAFRSCQTSASAGKTPRRSLQAGRILMVAAATERRSLAVK